MFDLLRYLLLVFLCCCFVLAFLTPVNHNLLAEKDLKITECMKILGQV